MSIEIDATKLIIKRSYQGGMHMSNGASRSHKYELSLKENEFFKDECYSETWTPKRGECNWGKGETVFFWGIDKKKKTYANIIELISSKYNLTNIDQPKPKPPAENPIKKNILGTISDLCSKFLYYDRKEDEELSMVDLNNAVANKEITVDEMVAEFRKNLEETFNNF